MLCLFSIDNGPSIKICFIIPFNELNLDPSKTYPKCESISGKIDAPQSLLTRTLHPDCSPSLTTAPQPSYNEGNITIVR